MTSDIPEDVAVESVFIVEATYGPDAATLRPRFRHEHLERIARLRDEGVVIEAGGCSDLSRSFLILRVASAAAARDLVEQDVYTRSGVWSRFDVCEFGRVCRPAELEDR